MLAALAFVTPANAGVKGDCVLDGNIKAQTTKSATGPAKYVQLLGGKGTFSLNLISLNCVTAPVAGKGPTTVSGALTTSGTFRNSAVAPGGVSVDTPCGQGKVLGHIDSVNVSDPKYQVLVGKKFAVEFGPPMNGAFFWHNANPNKPSTVFKTQPDDDPRYPGKGNTFGTKPYRYAGQIQLSTPSSEPPKANPQAELQKTLNFPNKCTKAFHVDGTVVVDEA
jgi:hypothetical protein